MTERGEPVQLPGKALYFLNWKYVRHGWMSYRREAQSYDGANPMAGMLYNGDGEVPARFEDSAMPRGIRLEAQHATLTPIAGDPLGHEPTVLFDRGKYRAWYATVPADNANWAADHKHEAACPYNAFFAYAESDDGLHWHKPSLGLIEADGSSDNNYILRNPAHHPGLGWGSVFIDPSSEDERYKMLFSGSVSQSQWEAFDQRYPGEINPMALKGQGEKAVRYGMFGAVSANGIHWDVLPEPLFIDHCDTLNTCCYDAENKRYVAYVRSWSVPRADPREDDSVKATWYNAGKRCVARCVSDDFRHFTRPEVFLGTGADMSPSHFWYTTCKTHLPEQPEESVLFPWRWEMEWDRGACYLFTSQDGLAWAQVPGGPVVEAGPLGSAEGGYVQCSPGLVALPGDRWGLPYTGWPIPHKYPGRNYQGRHGLFPGVAERSGYATWQRGRLVALVADSIGDFQTLSFYPPGKQLTLNAVIPPTGSIRIGVFERDMKLGRVALEGFTADDCDPLVGDELSFPVSWNGVRELPKTDRPLILHVFLRNAKLFSIGFA